MGKLRRLRRWLASVSPREPLVWYRHRGVKPNDVMVAAYPRSGSTWLRFLLFELLTGHPPGFATVNRGIPDVGQGEPEELLPNRGRMIKTHEPYHDVYRRAIYLVRDVRDVAVSEYFYHRKVGAFEGTLQSFVKLFLRGRTNGYGSWRDHVTSWLDAPIAKSNDLFVIRYEVLKAHTPENLAQIGSFLGLNWAKDRIRTAVENNSVRLMQLKEQKVAESEFRGTRQDLPFVRRGASGVWSEALDGDATSSIERACADLLVRLEYELVARASPRDSDTSAAGTRPPKPAGPA